jgi:hypothetical protein
LRTSTVGANVYYKYKEASKWDEYLEPIPVTSDCTIEFYARKSGMEDSEKTEVSYALVLKKEGIFQNHGTALQGISSYAGLFLDLPDVGRVYYGITRSGAYARLFRYNIAKEKIDLVETIPDAKGGWGIAFANNYIYIGTYLNANLYRFGVLDNKLEKLATFSDATYVWDMKVRDDALYIGTSPNAVIYKYNLRNGEFSKYEGFTAGQYVRSLEVNKGKIYVGTGPEAELIEYDTDQGNFRNILPEEYASDSFVYDMKFIDGKLYLGLSPSYDILQYDPASGQFRNLMRNSFTSSIVIPPSSGENFLHFDLLGILFEYNKTTDRLARILPSTSINYQLVASYLDPASNVVGIVPQGIYREYSPSGQIIKSIDFMNAGLAGIPEYPMSIVAFNNKVYLNGIRLRGFDPITNSEAYNMLIGEAKSMAFLGSSLLTANYPTAQVWQFPATILANISNSDMRDSRYNLLTIGNAQTRPSKIAADFSSMSFMVGTEPEYGQYGGALTYMNFRTGQSYTRRNLIVNHTINEVIYDSEWKEFAYIGTSASGGTGTEPLSEDAHVVKWDLKGEKILFDTIPETGNKTVLSMASTQDGLFVVTANRNICRLDPVTGEVKVRRTNTGLVRLVSSIDGSLYGASYTKLYRIDKNSLDVTAIREGFDSISAITEDVIANCLYIIDGYNLISYR